MSSALRASSGLIAAVVLSACGGFSPSASAPGAAIRTNAMTFPNARPGARKPWLAPDIANVSQLLFVSDLGKGTVDIYALPDLKPEGRLAGIKSPAGECSDNRGNVWIADLQANEMLEYSHAGKLRNTIAGVGRQSYSCAVNPANGALAVTDLTASNGGPGEVLVYASPSAKPVVLHNPDLDNYYNAAYDSDGNLWVTGLGVNAPMLSKCGASTCHTVVLRGGSIFLPGPIVWDDSKRELIVFDALCHDSTMACSYPVSTDGVVGTPTTYLSSSGTPLCNLSGAAVAPSGAGTIVAGLDNEYSCAGYKANSVDLWAYPGGGSPTHATSGVIYPWGAAISTK